MNKLDILSNDEVCEDSSVSPSSVSSFRHNPDIVNAVPNNLMQRIDKSNPLKEAMKNFAGIPRFYATSSGVFTVCLQNSVEISRKLLMQGVGVLTCPSCIASATSISVALW